MGALWSQLVGKLLGDPSPPIESEVEVGHNTLVCCGTMNVTEVSAREDTEEKEGTK